MEVFLRTYVSSRQSRGDLSEDSIDCPLIELSLITRLAGGPTYQFRRGAQRGLSDGILRFALLRFWETFSPASETLALHDIARQPGSPGRIFKVDESSLAERLETIERQTDGAISYGETAGMRQLYRRRKLEPYEMLAEAYTTGARRQ